MMDRQARLGPPVLLLTVVHSRADTIGHSSGPRPLVSDTLFGVYPPVQILT